MQRSLDFTMYDYVNRCIFVLTADGSNRPVYAYLNKRACTYLGIQMDEIVGRAAFDIFDGRAAYSLYRRQCTIWNKGEATEYEIALPVRGAAKWIRTNLEPVHDQDGMVTHMVGAFEDITEERNQLQAQAMTVAAASAMEDMVCLAAHDLRSPMGNLKSLAELLRKDFVDHGDGKTQLIDMIDSIADKTLGVVSEIMVQAMTSEAPVQRQRFDFGALCDDALVLLDPMRLHSVSYPRLDIDADYTTVHIVLRNLLDNAFKHTTSDNAYIEVSVERMNAQRLRFTVCDDGPGFASLDTGIGPVNDAAGFGLLGVRRLLQSRGGEFTIVSPQSGAGAEVQFELPGQIVDDVEDSKPRLQVVR